MRQILCFKKQPEGFTVIEILVAVSIVIIFSSVVYTNLNGGRVKARDARRVEDIKTLEQAGEAYFSEHSYVFASAISDLGEYFEGGNPPKDPLSSASYSYKMLSDGFCIGAQVELDANANTETCDSGNPSDNYKVRGPY